MGPSSGVFGPEARLTRQPRSIVLSHRSERPYRAALEPGTLQAAKEMIASWQTAELRCDLGPRPHPGPVRWDRGTAVPDGCEYELTLSEAGAEQRMVTRDGALTPVERELIGLLRPRSTPVLA